MPKLFFTEGGNDIVEGIELRNGKANPHGWSTYEVWLTKPEQYPGAINEEKIADLYCGEPINLKDGYGFRIED